MSGMSALLAYGYILSTEECGEWNLVTPAWNDDTYEMAWPDWVDPEDPVTSLNDHLFAAETGFKYARQSRHATRPADYYDEYRKAALLHPSKVVLQPYGHWNWDAQDVLLYAKESAHEADDGAETIENFVVHSTGWTRALHDALDILGLVPKQNGPKWILAPSVS